jgi:hypothetical protein
MLNFSNKILLSIATIATLVFAANLHAAQLFKGHTGNSGGSTYAPFVTFTKQAEKAGVRIEVNAGKTLTKSLIALAKGKIQFSSAIPVAYLFLGKQKKMYKKLKNGKQLQSNIRSILGYLAGTFHAIAFDNSGIKTFKDIKGKTVYTGPPGGSATASQEGLIRAITGYEPGKDYRAIHLAWGQGKAAMRDGKLDMYVVPAQIGSAHVQELALKKPIRIMTIPENATKTANFKRILKRPGRGMATVSKSTYKGQVNEKDMLMMSADQYIGTSIHVSEDVVYKVTKSFWENLADVHATAVSLQSITKETAFSSLDAPLHKGAYRYYKEAGFKIPSKLIPPEVK